MINEYLTQKEFNEIIGYNPLLSASIKVTRKCNLTCKHCYVSAGKGKIYEDEMEVNNINLLIDQLYDLGCLNLFINGGEPFLRKEIWDIYEHAGKKGFKISVSTNGFAMDQEKIDKLSEFKPELFQVSIDGLEETHDFVRNTKGAFKRAINTLNMAIEKFSSTETNVTMATTLMKDNANEIIDLYKFAIELGVKTYAVIPLMPTGSACNDPDIDISAEEKYHLFNKLAEVYFNSSRKTEISIIVPPALIPQSLRNQKYGGGYLCSFPYMLGIDSNGDVAPCDGLIGFPDMKLGNIYDNTVEQIWQSEKLAKISKQSYKEIKGVCSICRHVSDCVGGCRANSYLKNGDFLTSDPLCQEFYDSNLFSSSSLIGSASRNPLIVML